MTEAVLWAFVIALGIIDVRILISKVKVLWTCLNEARAEEDGEASIT